MGAILKFTALYLAILFIYYIATIFNLGVSEGFNAFNIAIWILFTFYVLRIPYQFFSHKGVRRKTSRILSSIGFFYYYDFMTFCKNMGMLIMVVTFIFTAINPAVRAILIPFTDIPVMMPLLFFGLFLLFLPQFDIDNYDLAVVYLTKYIHGHNIENLKKSFQAINDIYVENVDQKAIKTVIDVIYSKSYLRMTVYDERIQQLICFLKLKNPRITHDETMNFLNEVKPDLKIGSLFVRSSIIDQTRDYLYAHMLQAIGLMMTILVFIFNYIIPFLKNLNS
jgi:hypothetical protein